MIGKRMAFIGGAGRIGTALINGLLAAKAIRRRQVVVTARHTESLAHWRKQGLRCTARNADAARTADLLLLCVHPEDVRVTMESLLPALTSRHLIISVITGLPTAALEAFGKRPLRVVRAMPNTPVMVGQSMTCLVRGRHATKQDLRIAERIFATVGLVELMDEPLMNAATGLGGCGPAFAFKIIEALTEGGIKMGIPRTTARKMAAQVLKGSAELVLQTGVHPAELKDQVTTPAGCTIDGLAKLEERGLSIALIDAVETATLKAGRLYEPVKPPK